MNTQNTTVHIRLWHREFWLMAIANLLLSMSVTMLIPTLPLWMTQALHFSTDEVGLLIGAFAVGLFLPGVFCSYLVQQRRRNLVFVWCVLLLGVSMVLPMLSLSVLNQPWVIGVWRLAQGALFGLAQMVLTSTLIIDTCESHQRTEANHSATWFGRFALSLGPMTGLLLIALSKALCPLHLEGGCESNLLFMNVVFVSMLCCFAAVVLVLMIHFPFRIPEDGVHLFSLDRFFLTSGTPLFLNLMLVTIPVGMLMSMRVPANSYGMVMIGFFLALLAQRFVFRNAELKSEVVTGLIMMSAALVILLASRLSPLTTPLLGLGLGIVGTRFLLFFVKLSRHCQRGTSQSTFMLGWECGLALGVGIGYYCFAGNTQLMLSVALGFIIVALVMYMTFTHQWFVTHKNR
jgi:MFS family permease